jgi:hypothetical protein
MNALELQNDSELASEIEDLTAYLRGVPSELRESGAFAPYEARLQQLLENLITSRLKQALHRSKSHSPIQGPDSYETVQLWVHEAKRRHEEAAHGYLRTAAVLNAFVVALGAAAGIGALASSALVAAPLAGLAAIAGAAQLVFRPAEKSRTQQELADHLGMLRLELENIGVNGSSLASFQVAADRVERTLQMLNESTIN